MIKFWQKFMLQMVFWTVMASIMLYLALGWPSVASGEDKSSSEGYYGTDVVKLREKPVRAKSGETITYGYIGNNYVRIHKKTSKDGKTITRRGWVNDKYISTKEKQ